MVTASLGVPTGLAAQSWSSATLGQIAGEAVDAGGQALANQRIELLQKGAVIATTATDSRGDYSFKGIASGEYVVRMMVNGTVTGIRVVLSQDQVANALIVAPSAATPSPAFLAPLFTTFGVLGTSLVIGGIALGTVGIVKATGSH